MSEWKPKRLGNIAPFKYGKALTEEKRQSGAYPVYSSAGVCGLSDETLSNGGIIVGRKGTAGSVYYCDSPYWCIDTAFYIDDVESDINIKFLYFYMQTMKLDSFNNDAAVPGLNRNLAHKLKISVPDPPTQTRIADILSAYDDAIENNNRRIALLEKAAQELYREWFVRFRFPGHETAKFVNGLPEGWEVATVRRIADVKSGFAFKSEWWNTEGVPVIKIKDIQDGTIDLTANDCVSIEHARLAQKFYVSCGDLVIAMTGATIGKIGLVSNPQKMLVNQRVGKFFLGENPVENVGFLYCLLKQEHVQEFILMCAGSSAAQPNISPDGLGLIKTVYHKKTIEAFNSLVAPVFQLIIKLRIQSQNLARQRDLLLPRLMSGKLEV